jgi:hypothetical protein
MGTSGQFDIIYSEKVKLFIFLSIKLIASIEVLIDNPCLFFQKTLAGTAQLCEGLMQKCF